MLLPALFLLAAAAPDELEKAVKTFVDVWAIVEANAADKPSLDQAFYQGALPGAMKQLDPHSVFFDAGQFEQLKQLQKSTSKGFGSVVSVLPGRLIILQTLPGTPSARSGISPGDEIVAINGYQIAYLELEQLVQLLQASRQQEAMLEVRRPGSARVLQFRLIPEEMQAPSVDRAFLLEPGIGYVRISSFDENTGKDADAAVKKLGGESLKGLVLDLRNNPGGVMEAALEVSSMFLKPDQRLLTVKGRRIETRNLDVPKNNKPYDFPVAVLINEKSASASEIVAGAIQDQDRGQVIGEQSFGKGLVESVFPLTDGTGIALTTAYYYTPSGRSIQKPLQNSTLSTTTNTKPAADFKTAKGRTVKGGGGIQPDQIVTPEAQSRLRVVIEATGSFATFATEYLRTKPEVKPGQEIPLEQLDRFRIWLSERRIQPSIGDWSKDRDWIRTRLTQEVLNQALGVEAGDEIELRHDPVVRTAISTLY